MSGSYVEEPCGLGLEIFDPAPIGVWVTRGPDHTLVYTNSAYREFFGDRPLGEPLRHVFRDLLQEDLFQQFDRVYRTGEPFSLADTPLEIRGRSAFERYFTITLSRIPFGHGMSGVLCVLVEVTEQVVAGQQVRVLSEERRRALQRFESLVRAATPIIWVTSPQGGMIEPSPGWQRLTGQTWNEFRDDGWLQVIHPDDRPATMESWSRALKEMVPLWEHTYRLRTRSGGYRRYHARAVPVREDEVIVEWVGTSTDVERQWQEAHRKKLLERAAAVTAGIVRVEDMLSALCRVVVPELADGCAVYLLPDVSERPGHEPLPADRVASAVRMGLPPLHPHRQERFSPDSGFARAVQKRRAVYTSYPRLRSSGTIMSSGIDSWLSAASANSAVLLPLIVDGAVAAVVAAATCGDRAPISAGDVALIRRMLDHAHAPLSSAVEFRRTQRVALALQQSLLAEPPVVPGIEIAARYRASPSAAEVGGDWYDSFILTDGSPMLTIGDVAGHDLPAAVVMSQLRNMLRALAVDREEPPGDILRRLNLAMEALCGEYTATCVLARIEARGDRGWQAHYSCAGHPPPLLVTRDGGTRYLQEARSPLLGVLADTRRPSAVEPLEPQSTMFLYTDGLIEHPGEHLDDGLDRLARQAGALAREPLEIFCDELLDGVGSSGKDDIAMIALRVGDRLEIRRRHGT
ncbi:hypothetical protein Misp01_46570 [Microtetraspora sp. NBRC 13810]|uniref:SpoIIE family protein phosphatase n=1 Tax=Microtetraspora sp. NBRC 13810 TaxID=3030990 RepID=UPI0024A50F9E|nr:SpoIIE family protein phosphatase [Microtetraspora sp. NBRC 13810]GLW09528.1 hypothetical protein Misp01_46570 [Microtetraspora sp. NBRC 13810]